MKYLILVRHGWAGSPAGFKQKSQNKGLILDDDFRPLDERGRKEARQMVKGLKFLLKDSGAVLTSPLVRARQTAEILQKGLEQNKKLKVLEIPELRPETPPHETWQALQNFKHFDQVVAVGHEPQISKFLSFILTGNTLHPLPFKKGGVAVVELRAAAQKTDKQVKGELRCFIQPTHTKKIRKS